MGVVQAARASINWTFRLVVQLVVYNLPERDCSAKASDGEFHLSDAGTSQICLFPKVFRTD